MPTRFPLTILLAAAVACSRHSPEWSIMCGDGTWFSSDKAMPESRLCRGKGGVVNSVTIVDAEAKPTHP